MAAAELGVTPGAVTAHVKALEDRLGAALQAGVARGERRLLQIGGRLSPEPLHRRLDQRQARLDAVSARLDGVIPRRLDGDRARLSALSRALARFSSRARWRLRATAGTGTKRPGARSKGTPVRSTGCRFTQTASGSLPSVGTRRSTSGTPRTVNH